MLKLAAWTLLVCLTATPALADSFKVKKGILTAEGHKFKLVRDASMVGAYSSEATEPGGDFARLVVVGKQVEGLMRINQVYYGISGSPKRIVVEWLESSSFPGCSTEEVSTELEEAPTNPLFPASPHTRIPLREVELRTEADAELSQRFGGADGANAEIKKIVHFMNGIYEADLRYRVTVIAQRAFEGSDPYDSNSIYHTLCPGLCSQMFKIWQEEDTFDAALLFSGRTFDDWAIGLAQVRSVCKPSANAVVEYWYTTYYTALLASHELGHILGAGHSTEGIMYPYLQLDVAYFSDFSRGQIKAHTDTLECIGGFIPRQVPKCGKKESPSECYSRWELGGAQ